jgi:hypothetical protein
MPHREHARPCLEVEVFAARLVRNRRCGAFDDDRLTHASTGNQVAGQIVGHGSVGYFDAHRRVRWY